MNKKRILKISISVLVIVVISILGFTGNYFYNLAINPTVSKDMIFGNGEEAKSTSGQVLEEDKVWLETKSNYTDEYITSFDNLKLHGYKVINKTPTNKWAINVHGYTSQGINMSTYAKNFYDMGYNVLIPDLRAHGESEGDYIGMGWDDRLDIINWINYIIENDTNAEIILHGVSMGAATICMASGEELPSNVKAIIADCGYTSVWDQFSYQLDDLFGLPAFPFMHVSSIVTKIRAGYSLKDASPIKQVEKSKTPMLFIHGDQDDFVPYFMMDELYNATNSKKEKLIIEGAGHAKSSEINPEAYWSTIENFINKYI